MYDQINKLKIRSIIKDDEDQRLNYELQQYVIKQHMGAVCKITTEEVLIAIKENAHKNITFMDLVEGHLEVKLKSEYSIL